MELSRRRDEISRLNILFCLLVIFIHTASHPLSNLDRLSWQYALVIVPQRLAFVSVYGFFFLSGLKLTLPRSRHRTLGSYYLGRVKSLLLPYLFSAAVYYTFFVAIGWYTFNWGDFLSQTLLGTMVSPFYFVVTLAQFILLAPVFLALVKRCSPILTLPLALGITWLSCFYLPSILQLFAPALSFPYADRVFTTYLVFYLAGCYAGANYEKFLELLEQNRRFLTLATLFFALCNSILIWLNASGRQYIPYLGYVDSLYLLCAIPALYGWSVRRGPFQKSQPYRLLSQIDRASYLIYLYHSLVITIFNLAAERAGITKISVLFILRVLTVFPVTIFGCILWQKLWTALRQALPLPFGTKRDKS